MLRHTSASATAAMDALPETHHDGDRENYPGQFHGGNPQRPYAGFSTAAAMTSSHHPVQQENGFGASSCLRPHLRASNPNNSSNASREGPHATKYHHQPLLACMVPSAKPSLDEASIDNTTVVHSNVKKHHNMVVRGAGSLLRAPKQVASSMGTTLVGMATKRNTGKYTEFTELEYQSTPLLPNAIAHSTSMEEDQSLIHADDDTLLESTTATAASTTTTTTAKPKRRRFVKTLKKIAKRVRNGPHHRNSVLEKSPSVTAKSHKLETPFDEPPLQTGSNKGKSRGNRRKTPPTAPIDYHEYYDDGVSVGSAEDGSTSSIMSTNLNHDSPIRKALFSDPPSIYHQLELTQNHMNMDDASSSLTNYLDSVAVGEDMDNDEDYTMAVVGLAQEFDNNDGNDQNDDYDDDEQLHQYTPSKPANNNNNRYLMESLIEEGEEPDGALEFALEQHEQQLMDQERELRRKIEAMQREEESLVRLRGQLDIVEAAMEEPINYRSYLRAENDASGNIILLEQGEQQDGPMVYSLDDLASLGSFNQPQESGPNVSPYMSPGRDSHSTVDQLRHELSHTLENEPEAFQNVSDPGMDEGDSEETPEEAVRKDTNKVCNESFPRVVDGEDDNVLIQTEDQEVVDDPTPSSVSSNESASKSKSNNVDSSKMSCRGKDGQLPDEEPSALVHGTGGSTTKGNSGGDPSINTSSDGIDEDDKEKVARTVVVQQNEEENSSKHESIERVFSSFGADKSVCTVASTTGAQSVDYATDISVKTDRVDRNEAADDHVDTTVIATGLSTKDAADSASRDEVATDCIESDALSISATRDGFVTDAIVKLAPNDGYDTDSAVDTRTLDGYTTEGATAGNYTDGGSDVVTVDSSAAVVPSSMDTATRGRRRGRRRQIRNDHQHQIENIRPGQGRTFAYHSSVVSYPHSNTVTSVNQSTPKSLSPRNDLASRDPSSADESATGHAVVVAPFNVNTKCAPPSPPPSPFNNKATDDFSDSSVAPRTPVSKMRQLFERGGKRTISNTKTHKDKKEKVLDAFMKTHQRAPANDDYFCVSTVASKTVTSNTSAQKGETVMVSETVVESPLRAAGHDDNIFIGTTVEEPKAQNNNPVQISETFKTIRSAPSQDESRSTSSRDCTTAISSVEKDEIIKLSETFEAHERSPSRDESLCINSSGSRTDRSFFSLNDDTSLFRSLVSPPSTSTPSPKRIPAGSFEEHQKTDSHDISRKNLSSSSAEKVSSTEQHSSAASSKKTSPWQAEAARRASMIEDGSPFPSPQRSKSASVDKNDDSCSPSLVHVAQDDCTASAEGETSENREQESFLMPDKTNELPAEQEASFACEVSEIMDESSKDMSEDQINDTAEREQEFCTVGPPAPVSSSLYKAPETQLIIDTQEDSIEVSEENEPSITSPDVPGGPPNSPDAIHLGDEELAVFSPQPASRCMLNIQPSTKGTVEENSVEIQAHDLSILPFETAIVSPPEAPVTTTESFEGAAVIGNRDAEQEQEPSQEDTWRMPLDQDSPNVVMPVNEPLEQDIAEGSTKDASLERHLDEFFGEFDGGCDDAASPIAADLKSEPTDLPLEECATIEAGLDLDWDTVLEELLTDIVTADELGVDDRLTPATELSEPASIVKIQSLTAPMNTSSSVDEENESTGEVAMGDNRICLPLAAELSDSSDTAAASLTPQGGEGPSNEEAACLPEFVGCVDEDANNVDDDAGGNCDLEVSYSVAAQHLTDFAQENLSTNELQSPSAAAESAASGSEGEIDDDEDLIASPAVAATTQENAGTSGAEEKEDKKIVDACPRTEGMRRLELASYSSESCGDESVAPFDEKEQMEANNVNAIQPSSSSETADKADLQESDEGLQETNEPEEANCSPASSDQRSESLHYDTFSEAASESTPGIGVSLPVEANKGTSGPQDNRLPSSSDVGNGWFHNDAISEPANESSQGLDEANEGTILFKTDLPTNQAQEATSAIPVKSSDDLVSALASDPSGLETMIEPKQLGISVKEVIDDAQTLGSGSATNCAKGDTNSQTDESTSVDQLEHNDIQRPAVMVDATNPVGTDCGLGTDAETIARHSDGCEESSEESDIKQVSSCCEADKLTDSVNSEERVEARWTKGSVCPHTDGKDDEDISILETENGAAPTDKMHISNEAKCHTIADDSDIAPVPVVVEIAPVAAYLSSTSTSDCDAAAVIDENDQTPTLDDFSDATEVAASYSEAVRAGEICDPGSDAGANDDLETSISASLYSSCLPGSSFYDPLSDFNTSDLESTIDPELVSDNSDKVEMGAEAPAVPQDSSEDSAHTSRSGIQGLKEQDGDNNHDCPPPRGQASVENVISDEQREEIRSFMQEALAVHERIKALEEVVSAASSDGDSGGTLSVEASAVLDISHNREISRSYSTESSAGAASTWSDTDDESFINEVMRAMEPPNVQEESCSSPVQSVSPECESTRDTGANEHDLGLKEDENKLPGDTEVTNTSPAEVPSLGRELEESSEESNTTNHKEQSETGTEKNYDGDKDLAMSSEHTMECGYEQSLSLSEGASENESLLCEDHHQPGKQAQHQYSEDEKMAREESPSISVFRDKGDWAEPPRSDQAVMEGNDVCARDCAPLAIVSDASGSEHDHLDVHFSSPDRGGATTVQLEAAFVPSISPVSTNLDSSDCGDYLGSPAVAGPNPRVNEVNPDAFQMYSHDFFTDASFVEESLNATNIMPQMPDNMGVVSHTASQSRGPAEMEQGPAPEALEQSSGSSIHTSAENDDTDDEVEELLQDLVDFKRRVHRPCDDTEDASIGGSEHKEEITEAFAPSEENDWTELSTQEGYSGKELTRFEEELVRLKSKLSSTRGCGQSSTAHHRRTSSTPKIESATYALDDPERVRELLRKAFKSKRQGPIETLGKAQLLKRSYSCGDDVVDVEPEFSSSEPARQQGGMDSRGEKDSGSLALATPVIGKWETRVQSGERLEGEKNQTRTTTRSPVVNRAEALLKEHPSVKQLAAVTHESQDPYRSQEYSAADDGVCNGAASTRVFPSGDLLAEEERDGEQNALIEEHWIHRTKLQPSGSKIGLVREQSLQSAESPSLPAFSAIEGKVEEQSWSPAVTPPFVARGSDPGGLARTTTGREDWEERTDNKRACDPPQRRQVLNGAKPTRFRSRLATTPDEIYEQLVKKANLLAQLQRLTCPTDHLLSVETRIRKYEGLVEEESIPAASGEEKEEANNGIGTQQARETLCSGEEGCNDCGSESLSLVYSVDDSVSLSSTIKTEDTYFNSFLLCQSKNANGRAYGSRQSTSTQGQNKHQVPLANAGNACLMQNKNDAGPTALHNSLGTIDESVSAEQLPIRKEEGDASASQIVVETIEEDTLGTSQAENPSRSGGDSPSTDVSALTMFNTSKSISQATVSPEIAVQDELSSDDICSPVKANADMATDSEDNVDYLNSVMCMDESDCFDDNSILEAGAIISSPAFAKANTIGVLALGNPIQGESVPIEATLTGIRDLVTETFAESLSTWQNLPNLFDDGAHLQLQRPQPDEDKSNQNNPELFSVECTWSAHGNNNNNNDDCSARSGSTSERQDESTSGDRDGPKGPKDQHETALEAILEKGYAVKASTNWETAPLSPPTLQELKRQRPPVSEGDKYTHDPFVPVEPTIPSPMQMKNTGNQPPIRVGRLAPAAVQRFERDGLPPHTIQVKPKKGKKKKDNRTTQTSPFQDPSDFPAYHPPGSDTFEDDDGVY